MKETTKDAVSSAGNAGYVEPRRIYVRGRMMLWAEATTVIHGVEVGIDGPDGSCGVLLAYDSLAAFEAMHPGEEPLVFDLGGST